MRQATGAVILRMKALVDDLGSALTGPERDAARARDIIRSIITEVKVTPLDGPGKADGRGIGPVRVTVIGSLNELLGAASTDRVIQRRGTNLATLVLPTVAFEFYVDLSHENSETVEGVYPDVAVFSRLLDDTDTPVSTRELVVALHGVARAVTPAELAVLEKRARRAIYRLKEMGAIRAIRLIQGEAGWVWNDRAISDQEWRRRALEERRPDAPIGIVRVTPPEAYVVVITPKTAEG